MSSAPIPELHSVLKKCNCVFSLLMVLCCRGGERNRMAESGCICQPWCLLWCRPAHDLCFCLCFPFWYTGKYTVSLHSSHSSTWHRNTSTSCLKIRHSNNPDTHIWVVCGLRVDFLTKCMLIILGSIHLLTQLVRVTIQSWMQARWSGQLLTVA